jgi:hypothetical protein
MKRFVQTKLFRTLREASQKGIEVDAGVLEKEYDEFAKFLFSDGAASTDQSACYNALVYTHT